MSAPATSRASDTSLRDLHKLTAKGEGFHLEFKRKANHPEKIAREFVAFANAGGGILLLGVADDGTLPGVKHPEGDAHVIREALKKCKPALVYTETFIPASPNTSIIRFDIPASNTKPHSLKETDGVHAYIRVHDKCLHVSKELGEILRRLRRAKNIQFTFGESEKLLMQYLEVHKTITLDECTVLLKTSRWKASRKLVLLSLADVLDVTPGEGGDQYSRK